MSDKSTVWAHTCYDVEPAGCGAIASSFTEVEYIEVS
jgi:hypothetical protein